MVDKETTASSQIIDVELMLAEKNGWIAWLSKRILELEAERDSLMLEFCVERMTEAPIKNHETHQRIEDSADDCIRQG